MAVVRWVFYDPSTSDSYTVAINPNEGGTPARSKNIFSSERTAPDAGAIIMEGAEQPRQFQVSGVILTQAHLEALQSWFDKRSVIRITDDLSREFWVYISNFSATRKWSRQYPWRHEYQLQAVVVTDA